jgi:hypothetical protein
MSANKQLRGRDAATSSKDSTLATIRKPRSLSQVAMAMANITKPREPLSSLPSNGNGRRPANENSTQVRSTASFDAMMMLVQRLHSLTITAVTTVGATSEANTRSLDANGRLLAHIVSELKSVTRDLAEIKSTVTRMSRQEAGPGAMFSDELIDQVAEHLQFDLRTVVFVSLTCFFLIECSLL